jgi:pimeloyl-ACP methyl ester carboxylesterase
MDGQTAVRTAMERLLATGPATARSEWLDLPDVRLHHLEAGNGPPVVLLHGGTGGGANWFRMLGPLSERYRVLAPDLPGFGLSGPVRPEAPLGRAAARLLQQWLAAHDVRDALVIGTSFGGLAALRLAQQVPDRVGRLMLLDAAGLGRGVHPALRLVSLRPLTRLGSRPSLAGTRVLIRALLTSNRSAISDEQFDRLAEYLHASAVRAGTPYLADTLRLFVGPRGQREVLDADELAAIRQPVAIVWGERDRLLPVRHAHDAARAFPDATVRIMPGIGHSPNWEAPDALADAIHRLARRAQAHLA